METRARDVARLPAPAPSRPRLAAVADAKPRRRETPTTRVAARIAASHPRAASSDVANADAPPRSNRHLVPIVRSIALVSGPSHLFHARASYSCSCSCSYVPCVHFLVDQTCRRRVSSVAVCARRMHPWTTTTGRDGRSRHRARAVFRCSMRGIRASIGREVVAPQPYVGLARCRF